MRFPTIRALFSGEGHSVILSGKIGLMIVALMVAGLSLSSQTADVGAQPDEPHGPQAVAESAAMSTMQQAVAESEYHVTWQETTRLAGVASAWQAPNRAQGFRTYFTDDGIEVVPRTEETKTDWQWGLTLRGFGREDVVWSVPDPTLQPSDKRIDYVRGGLVEWYVNDRSGLEQGFTLAAPPETHDPEAVVRSFGARERSDGSFPAPAYVVLALTGNLVPALGSDGQAIDFHAWGGMQVLHYGGLVVRDAKDQEVPAWMELFNDGGRRGIRLVFDDIDAVYPVTVDPLLKDHAWSYEGNQTGAGTVPRFGYAVAGVGDLNGDGFNDVAIGAPYYDAGEEDEGAVFVFHGSPSGLSSSPDWMEDSDKADSAFGAAIARMRTTYDHTLAPADRIMTRVGLDVNNDGYDDLLVGAPQYDYTADGKEGMAFIFLGSATGLDHVGGEIAGHPGEACPAMADWCVEGKWNADNDDFFGESVSPAGDFNGDGVDDIAVGFPGYDDGDSDEGAIFVFVGVQDGLPSDTAYYRYENNSSNTHVGGESERDTFPTCLAAADLNQDGYDDLVVGVPEWGSSDRDGGVVFVFGGAETEDVEPELFYNYSEEGDDHEYGWSVAACDVNSDGHVDLVVGDPLANRNSTDEGTAWVYLGSADGPTVDTEAWEQDIDQSGAWFGYSVACAGDVNGDDFDDVIIGATHYDNPDGDGDTNFEGGAYLFHGSEDGLLPNSTTAAEMGAFWSRIGTQPYAQVGRAVAGAGDVNGDGYDDVLVGAPWYDGDKVDEGTVWLHHGAPEPRASDLIEQILSEPISICTDPSRDICKTDTDCSSGYTCQPLTPIDPLVRLYTDASDAPEEGSEVHGQGETGTVAVYYGPDPNSIVLSTGLAHDLGFGNTDFDGDGEPDLVRLQFDLPVPEDMKTLRFNTQFINGEIAAGRDKLDDARIYFSPDPPSASGYTRYAGAETSAQAKNPPITHGINVEGLDQVRLSFQVADDGDGLQDSALVVSRMFFSAEPVPEGEKLWPVAGEGTPDYLRNPTPQDISATAGTFSYQKELLSVPGIGLPFSFTVRYNSASVSSGSLGEKWIHSFESTAQKTMVRDLQGTDTVDKDLVIVKLGNGSAEQFRCSDHPDNPSSQLSDDKCGDEDYPCRCTAETLIWYAPVNKDMGNTLSQVGNGLFTYTTKAGIVYYFGLDMDAPPGSTTDRYETGALTSITDRNGNRIELFYDGNKRLDYVLDTRGKVITFNYDGNDLLTSVVHPGGGDAAVLLDYVASVDAQDEIVRHLASFTDLNGDVTSFTYDDRGNLETGTDDDGITFVTSQYESYSGLGLEQKGDRVTTRRSAIPGDAGIQTTFRGDRLENVDRLLGFDFSVYDVKGRSVRKGTMVGLDPRCDPADPVEPCCNDDDASCWSITSGTYYENDLARTATGPLGDVTTMDYDDKGNLTCRKDDLGYVTTMWYDDRDNLIYQAVHKGTTSLTCNPMDQTQARTECLPFLSDPFDPSADDCNAIDSSTCAVTAYCYDDDDNLIEKYESDSSLGSDLRTYYDSYDPDHEEPPNPAPGQLASETDRRGNVTDYEYDEDNGWLSQVTSPDPGDGNERPKVAYAYDALGRVSLETTCSPNGTACDLTSPNPTTTAYLYDAEGNLLAETDALGYRTDYEYDTWNRLTRQVSPQTPWSTQPADSLYTYTPSGRPHETKAPMAVDDQSDSRATVSYAYDEEDRLVAVTDPAGRTTDYTCDAADRLVAVTDSADRTSFAVYDLGGNLKEVTDPNGSTTSFEYDSLGRITKETDPASNDLDVSYTEDALGLVDVVSSADSSDVARRSVDFEYDKTGRLVGVDLYKGDIDGDPDRSIRHTLDAVGNRTETTDELFAIPTPPTFVVAQTFDGLDRLVTRTDPFGNTVAYTYDVLGNLIELCYSYNVGGQSCNAASTVSYTYDLLGRLTQVEDWLFNTTSYIYDEVGNLTEVTLPDGSTVNYTYDGANRLTGIEDSVGFEASYTLNDAGQRIGATVELPPPPEAGFGSLSVRPLENFAHDNGNLLTSRNAAYDADGNLIAGDLTDDGTRETMRFDELNQLVAIDIDGEDPVDNPDAEYRYDSEGYRVEVTQGSETRRYVYDTTSGTPRLLEERDDTDALIARYVYGLGLISRNVSAVGLRVYHFDSRGSTLALTDQGGTITDQYRYAPYGGVIDRDGPLAAEGTFATDRNPFTYNGRDGVFDDDNGLYLMRTRYYSPDLMRFIQKDGIFTGGLEDPQSLNRYAYVRGDPITRVDPNGDFWNIVAGAAIGAIVNVGLECMDGDCSWAEVGGAALEGAVVGGLMASGAGTGAMILGGAIAGAGGNALEQVIEGGDFDLGEVGIGAAEGALSGIGGGGAAGKVGAKVGKKVAVKSAQKASTKAGSKAAAKATRARYAKQAKEFKRNRKLLKRIEKNYGKAQDVSGALDITLPDVRELLTDPVIPPPPPTEPAAASPGPPAFYSYPATNPSGAPSPCH